MNTNARDIASQAINELTLTAEASVDIRRLLRAILREFGGEDGLAIELHQEFGYAQKGAPVRSRMLLDIMKLINAVGPDEDSEELDQEDLEALARVLMKYES